MKEIQLTQGKFAIVDDEDFEWLSKYRWFCNKPRNVIFRHTPRNHYKRKDIIMSREILNFPKGLQVDHINGNRFDNRRSNLRICNHAQNNQNKRIQLNNTSGYKGVSWSKHAKKWLVRIKSDKKQKYLGYFKNKKEAALVYNQAAIKYHKEFAFLNQI